MISVQTSSCVIPVRGPTLQALQQVKARYDEEAEFPVPHVKLFHPFVDSNKFELFKKTVDKLELKQFELEFNSIGHRELGPNRFAIVFEPSASSLKAFDQFWKTVLSSLPDAFRTVNPRPWIQLGTSNRQDVDELKHKIANQITCFTMPVNCLVCAELRGNLFHPKVWMQIGNQKPRVSLKNLNPPQPKNCSTNSSQPQLVFGEPGFYEVTSTFNMQTGHRRLGRGKLVLVEKVRGGSAEISFPSRGTIQFSRRNLKARFRNDLKVGLHELVQKLSVQIGSKTVKVRHGSQVQIKNVKGGKALVSFKKKGKRGHLWTKSVWINTTTAEGELLFFPLVQSTDDSEDNSSVCASVSSLSSNVGSSIYYGETSTFEAGIYRTLVPIDVYESIHNTDLCVNQISGQRSVYVKEVRDGYALLSAPTVGWVRLSGRQLIPSTTQQVLDSIAV